MNPRELLEEKAFGLLRGRSEDQVKQAQEAILKAMTILKHQEMTALTEFIQKATESKTKNADEQNKMKQAVSTFFGNLNDDEKDQLNIMAAKFVVDRAGDTFEDEDNADRADTEVDDRGRSGLYQPALIPRFIFDPLK